MESIQLEIYAPGKDPALLDLLVQWKQVIIASWNHEVRKSLVIPLSEDELLRWLSKWLDTFIQVERENIAPSINASFADLVVDLQKSGASLGAIIEILLLLPIAILAVKPQHGNRIAAEDERRLTDLTAWTVHIAAESLAGFVDEGTKELKKQQERTATLLRVAQATSSSLDLEEVFRKISTEVVHALDAYTCSSFLFPTKSKNGNYFLLDPSPLEEYQVPDPPELFMSDALNRKVPVTCYDAALDPRTDKVTVEHFQLKSLMAFPLLVQGKAVAVGLLVMNDYHHFTQEEIDLVMGIANSAAMAVENARLHELSLQLAIAQERNRLAQEMHDRLAQALAVTKLNLNTVLMAPLDPAVQTTIQETKSLVDETYLDLRDTIFGLRATNESDPRFLDNFKEYVATLGAHNHLEIHFDLKENVLKLFTGETILQVSRIMEEALSNIKEHANASHVWIDGGFTGKVIWITVEDDGVGIHLEDIDESDLGHFGIKIMRERAEAIGGRCTFGNRAGGGTIVRLEIPYK